MCTKVSPNLTDPTLRKKAEELGVHQNTGMLDAYFDKAREVCSKYDVTVCDLYLVWQTMAQNSVNVTELLSNKLNHPTYEYHYYIAVNCWKKCSERTLYYRRNRICLKKPFPFSHRVVKEK